MTVKELIDWLSVVKETTQVKIHTLNGDRPLDLTRDIDIDRRNGSIVFDAAQGSENSTKIAVEIPDYTADVKPEHKQLRMHRILAGIKITDIAKKAKVSKQYIYAIEQGSKNCPDYILKIYRGLKLRSGTAF